MNQDSGRDFRPTISVWHLKEPKLQVEAQQFFVRLGIEVQSPCASRTDHIRALQVYKDSLGCDESLQKLSRAKLI